MDFHKNVLIAGTGKSGLNAGKLLLEKGAEIIFYDDNASLDVEKLLMEMTRLEWYWEALTIKFCGILT